jgi:hypothetical protein
MCGSGADVMLRTEWLNFSSRRRLHREQVLVRPAAGKYSLVPRGGQVLARSVVLIKYLLLGQTYPETL